MVYFFRIFENLILFSYHNGEGEDWGKYLHNVVGGRIVAVKLEPRSIDHEGAPAGKCQDANAKPMVIPANAEGDISITYSYSVTFKVTQEGMFIFLCWEKNKITIR